MKKNITTCFFKFLLFSILIVFSFSTFSCSEKRQNLKLREKIKIEAVTERIIFLDTPFFGSFGGHTNEFKKTEETYVNVFEAKSLKPTTYYFELINSNFEDIYLTEAQIIKFLLSDYHLTLDYETFGIYFLTKGENPYTNKIEFYYFCLTKDNHGTRIRTHEVNYDFEPVDYDYDCPLFEKFGVPKLFFVTKR